MTNEWSSYGIYMSHGMLLIRMTLMSHPDAWSQTQGMTDCTSPYSAAYVYSGDPMCQVLFTALNTTDLIGILPRLPRETDLSSTERAPKEPRVTNYSCVGCCGEEVQGATSSPGRSGQIALRKWFNCTPCSHLHFLSCCKHLCIHKNSSYTCFPDMHLVVLHPRALLFSHFICACK